MLNRLCKPQRFLPAPPGSLLKRALDLRAKKRRPANDDNDLAYLRDIRACPCLRCGCDPAGEAAHIRRSSPAHGKFNGMGAKPADRFVVSLCAGCHREDSDALHRVGEPVFFALLGLDPLLICDQLYAVRGDLVRMRAVVFRAIAER